MVTSLDRNEKNKTEFRMKDGSNPIFPDDRKSNVVMLVADATMDSVFRVVINAGSNVDL